MSGKPKSWRGIPGLKTLLEKVDRIQAQAAHQWISDWSQLELYMDSLYSLSQSLIAGFLLGYSAMRLVSRINSRYTQWEESLCRLLLKRGKKD